MKNNEIRIKQNYGALIKICCAHAQPEIFRSRSKFLRPCALTSPQSNFLQICQSIDFIHQIADVYKRSVTNELAIYGKKQLSFQLCYLCIEKIGRNS